jgi:hypothetical protein
MPLSKRLKRKNRSREDNLQGSELGDKPQIGAYRRMAARAGIMIRIPVAKSPSHHQTPHRSGSRKLTVQRRSFGSHFKNLGDQI